MLCQVPPAPQHVSLPCLLVPHLGHTRAVVVGGGVAAVGLGVSVSVSVSVRIRIRVCVRVRC